MATPEPTARSRMEERFRHWRYDPPYRISAVIMGTALMLVLVLTWLQFRGVFEPTAELTVMSGRAGLSMDPGSKVTYNGVPIGRLQAVDVDDRHGECTQDVGVPTHARSIHAQRIYSLVRLSCV